jgi:hypothetical protein
MTSRPLQSVITTYKKGFQFTAWTDTTASSHGTPEGFQQISISGLNRHNSERPRNSCRIWDCNLWLAPTQQRAPKELLKDFKQYSYSPVTTQQQAPKELLQDLISIYGLNRHNSKLPRNFCRISNNNQTQKLNPNPNHTRTLKSFVEIK